MASNGLYNKRPNLSLGLQKHLLLPMVAPYQFLTKKGLYSREFGVCMNFTLAKAVALKDSIKKVKVCDSDYFLGSEDERIWGKNLFEPLQWVGDDSC